MNLIQIVILLIVILQIYTVSNLIVDPICQQCLEIDQRQVEKISRDQTNLTLFNLPGFSQCTIMVDLRHLDSLLTDNNGTIFQLFFNTTKDPKADLKNEIKDLIIGTNQYEFTTTATATLIIYYQVNSDYKAYQYLLRNSVSLKLSYSNNRIINQDSSYVFLVTSQDNINLPKNRPDLETIRFYYLQNQRSDTKIIPEPASTESTSYWKTDEKFVVPYFPYFANCQNEGNMIEIMQALQNQKDCNLIPINSTKWINQFTFGSSAVADICTIKRKCMIEGEVEKKEYPEWQTLPIDSPLFYISRQKIQAAEYQYNMDLNDNNLVECKINMSSGSNSSDKYPLRVKITMGYYQVSQIQKRIIKCYVDYSLYVSSTANFKYQLQIYSYPLNHTYIMLSFGFQWYVYMIVFIMIGLISNVEHFILWLYHYLVTEVAKPIRIKIYLRVIKQVVKGTLFALGLLMLCLVVVCIIMNGKMFEFTFYDQTTNGSYTPRVIWDYIMEVPVSNYDSSDVVNIRAGRMGLAFLVIGGFIILTTCQYFIGKEKNKDQYKDYTILGRVFRPLDWNRSKFLFGTLFYILIQFYFIYMAYSSLYSENIWTFIVLMKLIQMIMEEITLSVYQDALPGLPFKILTDITAYLNTLSANDFYDFLFSFLVDVAMTMIEKAYVSQLQNIVVDKIKQKSEELNKFYVNLMNDSEQQVQQNANLHENQQNVDNQRVFIHRQSQQVEFFQEEIKQIYSTQSDSDSMIVAVETSDEKKLKNKYFQALSKEYQKQRELLLKDNSKEQHMLMEEQKIKNYGHGINAAVEQDPEQIMQRQSMIFEFLVDNVALIYTFLLQPFVVFALWVTYDESAILSEYGISLNTVVLYNLSAIVIGLFSVINVILIFHILESYMDISFHEQITSLLKRFFERSMFWKANDEDLNMNVEANLRGADHYCLSSQFFFILTIYLSAMILAIVGLAIMFNKSYNVFNDIASIPIILFWLLLLFLFRWICERICKLISIWDYNMFQTSQNQENQNRKFFAVKDQVNFDDSEFKTENIYFFDDFSKENLIIDNGSRKTFGGSKNASSKGSKMSIQLFNKKKNRYKIDSENLKIENFQAKNQILLAHKRLQTICKKLQPLFVKDSFKMEYSLANKEYIKQNIEKVLPLVEFLPELQEYKNLHNAEVKFKQEEANKKQQTKNMQPGIAQLILSWFRITEKQRQNRIKNGLEYESQKKKCSFCYSTWGLYYGYGGICLECSLRMIKLKKLRHEEIIKNQKSRKIFNQKGEERLNVIHQVEEGKSEYSMAEDKYYQKMHKD